MNRLPTRLVTTLLLWAACIFMAPAQATLTIKITQGSKAALPIAVVPFSWEIPGVSRTGVNISEIIENDLHTSGAFAPVEHNAFLSLPHAIEDVQYEDWRILGTSNLVIGRIMAAEEGFVEIRFRLLDTISQKQLAGKSLIAPTSNLRRAAHEISNIIYEQLTGQKGAFTTRIAYVAVEGNRRNPTYKLLVADADGHDPQTIFKYHEPVLSPDWSPDGRKLAYVSMEQNRSEIFVQDLRTGEREKISAFKGINGAPAWSPNGKELAMALSRSGNLEIYIFDLESRGLRRLTQNLAIDTEPVWTPDGKSIIFTSDRSGGPQLYRVDRRGGPAERLTFEGRYNALADISPDGKKMAFIHREKGRYQVAVMDLATRNMLVLTEGRLDESPSFSPNGSMIIYATQEGNKGILAAVSPDGEIKETLTIQKGSVREPDWSPFFQ